MANTRKIEPKVMREIEEYLEQVDVSRAASGRLGALDSGAPCGGGCGGGGGGGGDAGRPRLILLKNGKRRRLHEPANSPHSCL